MTRPRTFLILAASACLATTAVAQSGGFIPNHTFLVDHVERNGVRWEFDEAELCGRYANGDWWVKGPVTITDITPGTEYVAAQEWWRNGTMINPSAVTLDQGLDNSIYETAPGVGQLWYAYDHSLNIAAQLPYTVAAGSSVVTCESQELRGQRSQVRRIEVLTVVADTPAVKSFRPAYTGPGPKTAPARQADLTLARLQGLPTAKPASIEAVNWNAVAESVDGVWYEAPGIARYMKRQSRPSEVMPDYGRDVQRVLWNAMLPTFMNDSTKANKRATVINLVQIGLDRYAMAIQDPATYGPTYQTYGGHWDGGAGHGDGAKLSMYYAGWLLGDTAMMDAVLPSPTLENQVWHSFQEDDQPFVVKQTNPEQVNYGLCGYGTVVPVGEVDWGISHFHEVRTWGLAVNDDPRWFIEEEIPGCPPNGNSSKYRTCCTATNWWGSHIASRIIAAERGLPAADLFTQAFYDYLRRYEYELVTVRGLSPSDPLVYGSAMQRECFLAWDGLY